MTERYPIEPDDTEIAAALKQSLKERYRHRAFLEGRRHLVRAWRWPDGTGSVVVWAQRPADSSDQRK